MAPYTLPTNTLAKPNPKCAFLSCLWHHHANHQIEPNCFLPHNTPNWSMPESFHFHDGGSIARPFERPTPPARRRSNRLRWASFCAVRRSSFRTLPLMSKTRMLPIQFATQCVTNLVCTNISPTVSVLATRKHHREASFFSAAKPASTDLSSASTSLRTSSAARGGSYL